MITKIDYRSATIDELNAFAGTLPHGKVQDYTKQYWGHAIEGCRTVGNHCTTAFIYSALGISAGDTIRFNSKNKPGKVAIALVLESSCMMNPNDMYEVTYSIINYDN